MGLFGLVFALGLLAFVVVCIAAHWKLFEKAGKPGWACLIPLYNMWVTCEIVGLPGIAMLAAFVPFVNFLFILYLTYRLARVFGQDILFTLGLILLFPIFIMILAFGQARYLGPDAA